MITHTVSKKIIVLALVLGIAGTGFISALAPRAEAQFAGLTTDALSCFAAGSIASILSGLFSGSITTSFSSEVPVSDSGVRNTTGDLVNKEYSLDCIVWAAAKAIVNSITQSVLGWAQSGNWNNTPFFVEDPSQYFASLGDDVSDLFIDELADVGTNISPNFKTSLIRAIALDTTRISYQESQLSRCAVDTTDAFVNDFSGEGGWDTFLEITSNPQNTPFGCYAFATAELERRKTVVAKEQKDFLDWGGGFLPQLNPATGSVLTPGSTIRDQLTRVISSGLAELENADELAEILAAFASSLITTIFGGGGLLNAN